MKIIVSPDSFKGSCSAIEVADSIEKAIHEVDSTVCVVKMPVADGGEESFACNYIWNWSTHEGCFG